MGNIYIGYIYQIVNCIINSACNNLNVIKNIINVYNCILLLYIILIVLLEHLSLLLSTNIFNMLLFHILRITACIIVNEKKTGIKLMIYLDT